MEMVVLLGRHAAGKKVSLEFKSTGDEPEISSNPVILQYLLYLLTMSMIESVSINGRIVISVNGSPGPAAQIRIVAEPVDQAALSEVEDTEELKTCLGKLGVAISAGQSLPGRHEMVIDLAANTGR